MLRTHVFVQARMSSNRLPGKMLKPIGGVPLIKIIIDRLSQVQHMDQIVVLTSTETSDDVLVSYLSDIGCKVFRGDLDNVVRRFQQAIEVYPCDYFVRICGDSPWIDPDLVDFMIEDGVKKNVDFISNVETRTFPKGQSVEIIKSSVFSKIDPNILSKDEQEHVTTYFYKMKMSYTTLFYTQSKNQGTVNQCVDTWEDLQHAADMKNEFAFRREDVCRS